MMTIGSMIKMRIYRLAINTEMIVKAGGGGGGRTLRALRITLLIVKTMYAGSVTPTSAVNRMRNVVLACCSLFFLCLANALSSSL